MKRWISGIAVLAAMCLVGNAHAAITTWMYWVEEATTTSKVYRAPVGGSADQKQLIYSGNAETGYINFIDIDKQTGKLYYRGTKNGLSGPVVLGRSNLAGLNWETIPSAGLSTIQYGFAVNPLNGDMYMGGNGIARVSLDGSSSVLAPASLTMYPHDMEVDPVGGNLYFSDSATFNGILRSNLNGNGREVLANFGPGFYSGPGYCESTGIALNLASNELFFTRHSQIPTAAGRPNTGSINRLNLTTGVMTTLLANVDRPQDIEFDAVNQRIFWTANAGIFEADVIRSNGTVSVSGATNVMTLGETTNWWSAEGFALDTNPFPNPPSSS